MPFPDVNEEDASRVEPPGSAVYPNMMIDKGKYFDNVQCTALAPEAQGVASMSKAAQEGKMTPSLCCSGKG